MNIKLLALDMDGTAYYRGGTIVPANVEPIQKALNRGVEVAIVTGRPALAPQNELKKNGFDHRNAIMIACNGGCIYNFNENKIIKSNAISSDDAKVLFDLVDNEFPNVELWGYVDDLKTVIDSRLINHTDGYEFESRFFEGKYLNYRAVQKDFNFNFFKILAFNVDDKKFIERIAELKLEYAYALEEKTVEINAKGIDKGYAVAWLAKLHHIDIKNTMAIGDGANDVPMIKCVEYGVSLENSVAEVKKYAKIHIDKTNTEGGVAEAINQYILK